MNDRAADNCSPVLLMGEEPGSQAFLTKTLGETGYRAQIKTSDKDLLQAKEQGRDSVHEEAL